VNVGFLFGKLAMTRRVDRGARWLHQVFLNGFLLHPQVGGDLGKAIPLLMQHFHPLVTGHSSLLGSGFCCIIPFEWEIFAQHHLLRGSQKRVDLCVAAANSLINCFMKILTEMESISDLNRLRSTETSCFCILSCAVTTDDLDRGVAFEPSSDRSAVSVRQEIKSAMPLQVADDGPIAKPATPGPIIKTHHARWLDSIIGKTAQQAQKRVRATDHGQSRRDLPRSHDRPR
jgi:hypothetical protein